MTGTCEYCGDIIQVMPCCGKLVTRDHLDSRCPASETGRHEFRTYR